MSETSNQSFDHSKHINHVIAPEKPTTSGGTPSPENKNKSKFPVKYRILSAVAGVALIGGGAGIWAATAGEAPAKAPTHSSAPKNPTKPSHEATPSATPTPENATGPDSYSYGVTEADVDGLLHDTPTQINQLPLDQRAEIVEYYANKLPAFAKDWQLISENPLDVLPVTVSEDNTPDEINAFVTMQARQAMTLTQSDGFHFDETAADAYIAAQLMDGTLSKPYNSLTTFASQAGGSTAANSARSLAVSNYLQLPVINHASAKYKDAAGLTCVDMNTTQQLNTGESVTGDSTACLVTNKYGSVWMQR